MSNAIRKAWRQEVQEEDQLLQYWEWKVEWWEKLSLENKNLEMQHDSED